MRIPSRRTMALLAMLALGALTAAGCGSKTNPGSSAASNAVDRAFVQQMIPHHEMAVQMARAAAARAQHTQIKTLSSSIIATQSAEIAKLTAIARQLSVTPAAAGASAMHDMTHMNGSGNMDTAAKTLGIPAAQMGMSMNMSALDTARPFDRAFIDMMIPHHQGAIRMALAELAQGRDGQLKTIADAIVAAQTSEIDQMNKWRTAWYGHASPAGGAPSTA